MRSTTAASNRRRGTDPITGKKRSLEELDEQRKRILMDRLMAENAAMAQGDPRYMAQYAVMTGMRFPPGMPPGMPPMMMQRFGPGGMMQPGMFNMQQPNQQPQGEGGEEGSPPTEGEQGETPQGQPAEGGDAEGGEQEGDVGADQSPAPQQQGQQPPTPQGEQEIINSAVAALRYAA